MRFDSINNYDDFARLEGHDSTPTPTPTGDATDGLTGERSTSTPSDKLADAGVYFVRVGALAQVGRFRAVDSARHPRHARVVCRTPRGLEVGEVLNAAPATIDMSSCDGTLLRRLTAADELLVARLEKNRQQAYNACVQLLQKENVEAVLLDVEHLFDGQSLVFHFLGPTTPEIERRMQELAETYEMQAQFRSFAAAVEHGCGPGCGTDDAAGCGSDCASCSLASACKLKG